MKRTGLAKHLRYLNSIGVAMVPFRDAKLLYMKPPRTGGTSIVNVLRSNIICVRKHNLPNWLKNITDDELEEYFIFSFVRNPWDRLISVAKYFGVKPKDVVRGYRYGANDKKISLSLNAQNHALPCSLFTYKDGKQFVDMIYRYETIQEHFDILCDKIGIPKTTLPRRSVSRIDRDYKKHYSVGGRLDLRVREKYKDDIELLRYEF